MSARIQLSWALPLVAAAACSTPTATVVPRFGSLDIDGEFGISGTVNAESNDISSIGLEDDNTVFSGRADLGWGSPHLTLAFSASDHSGMGMLDAELSQGGVTLPVNTAVDSTFKLGLSEALLTFDLIPSDVIELGLGFGAIGLDMDVDIVSVATGDRVFTDEFAVAPVLALRGAGKIGPIELSGLLAGLDVEVDGTQAQVLDLDLAARWQFTRNSRLLGALTAGWRRFSLGLDYQDSGDEVQADFALTGPYFGLAIGF
jgi:hypothetical protein